MLRYSDLVIWAKDYELVLNRVKVINQLYGCSYVDSPSNPCRIVYDHGEYSVFYLDGRLCTFGVYDVPGVSSALAVVDSYANSVWSLSCSGLLAV